MKFPYGFAAGLLVAFVAGGGCTEQKLHVQISNATASEITETAVYFGQSRCGFGVVGPGNEKTSMFYQGTITEQAAVKWIDPRGNTVERTVKVSEAYDLKQSGTLHFQIGSNDVKVLFVPRGKHQSVKLISCEEDHDRLLGLGGAQNEFLQSTEARQQVIVEGACTLPKPDLWIDPIVVHRVGIVSGTQLNQIDRLKPCA